MCSRVSTLACYDGCEEDSAISTHAGLHALVDNLAIVERKKNMYEYLQSSSR
jgi:hypothetical protein